MPTPVFCFVPPSSGSTYPNLFWAEGGQRFLQTSVSLSSTLCCTRHHDHEESAKPTCTVLCAVKDRNIFLKQIMFSDIDQNLRRKGIYWGIEYDFVGFLIVIWSFEWSILLCKCTVKIKIKCTYWINYIFVVELEYCYLLLLIF